MNSESFFENFELLAESPNAIQKLREMILQMAVQGKLVPQNSDDETAEVLLERIKNEKERLAKEGKIRKQKKLPLLDDRDFPYGIPKNWAWVYLGQISQIVGGGTPKTSNPNYFSENEISWLTPADLYSLKSKYIGKGKRDITESGLQNSSAQLMPAGSVLFSSRAPIGYVAIALNDLATNQGFKSCVPFIMGMNEYVYYFLKSAVKEINNNATGTTFKEVSGKIVNQIKFPLPPLEEQKRIVAKVDQLMALCDQLESFQQKKNESRIQLNNSALNKMLDADSPGEFAEHWQLVCENFDQLYDDLDNVEKLKQAILQLAVQGKLVEQDANDETAEVLLEKIKVDKERLVKEGKIKKSIKFDEIKESEIPYGIPDNWKWVRLIDLCDIGTGSTPLKTQTEYYQNGTIPWITSSATSLEFVDNAETHITQKALDECHLRLYPSGTLIIALYGQGKTRGQVAEIQIEATINQACAALVFIDSLEVNKRYVKLVLTKQYVELRSLAAGGAQPNLNVGKIKNAFIPLPPLEEQKRIIAKVDQLMTLCDQLEAKIRQAQSDSDVLMEVAVSHLLEV